MYMVSSRETLPVLLPMLRASQRRGASWGCFFTDSGVEVLDNAELLELLSRASHAVACEFSWEKYRAGKDCPVESGSQTNNSALTAQARHVISL